MKHDDIEDALDIIALLFSAYSIEQADGEACEDDELPPPCLDCRTVRFLDKWRPDWRLWISETTE